MLSKGDFPDSAAKILEWIDHYLKNIESFPVKSRVKPGEITNALEHIKSTGKVDLDEVIQELNDIVLPGITHWQHPNFHAYFPANSSIESVLAEFVTAALGAQCMMWQTSPVAAEMEEFVLNWLKRELGLPEAWEGVIQDTASTATLTALLTAREVKTGFSSNMEGVSPGMRVYGSKETHSSIEKAVGIAGIGRKNFVAIEVDDQQALVPDVLESCIKEDLADGLIPLCVVATIGTTGTLGVDPLAEISEICQKYKVWLHVDAAYAGTALILEEYRWMIKGMDRADSFVFNPHKWMFTNFDCSAYYVKNAEYLVRTFDISPEYLKTSPLGQVKDYKDWGIPLGRRFRALKLWFVLRLMGVEGIRLKLRNHIEMAKSMAEKVSAQQGLEVVSGPFLNFFAFRSNLSEDDSTNDVVTEALMERLNASGVVFLSHTKLNGRFIVRMVIGQTYVNQAHVDRAFDAIVKELNALKPMVR